MQINDLMEKETDALWSLSSMAPLCPFDPFALLAPIRLPHSLGPFLLPCFAQTSASPILPAISFTSEIVRPVRIRCRAAISSLNTSTRPTERAVDVIKQMVIALMALFRKTEIRDDL